MVADSDLSDLSYSVLHLADDGLLRHPGRDPRHPLGRHLRFHAIVERVHLCTCVPVLAWPEDRAGRRHIGADPRRCILLGTADGWRPARINPGCYRLFVFRRALRRRIDRIGKGLTAPRIMGIEKRACGMRPGGWEAGERMG